MVSALLLAATTFQTQPLFRAHSHNDYLRPRPLFDALEVGAISVEIDVFLKDGRLMVAHSAQEIESHRTIQYLYFENLRMVLKATGKNVYPGSKESLVLLIDIKSGGEVVYTALKRALQSYPEFKYTGPSSAVRFIISGDRPIGQIAADKGKVAGLDGRWGDLDKGYTPEVMPWISESWGSHFAWKGEAEMSSEEGAKLRSMVDACHAKGYKLRFWGAPDREEVWKVLWEAGVDMIGTDQPKKLAVWMRNQKT